MMFDQRGNRFPVRIAALFLNTRHVTNRGFLGLDRFDIRTSICILVKNGLKNGDGFVFRMFHWRETALPTNP
jgi:hypothetical protein